MVSFCESEALHTNPNIVFLLSVADVTHTSMETPPEDQWINSCIGDVCCAQYKPQGLKINYKNKYIINK